MNLPRRRSLEALLWAAAGCTYREIAEWMTVAEPTVWAELYAAKQRYRLHDRWTRVSTMRLLVAALVAGDLTIDQCAEAAALVDAERERA